MEHTILNELLIIFTASVLASAIFTRLHVPTLICYLVVGVLLGPNGLKLVQDPAPFQMIAEFGVAFLLFTLGLEFSLAHMIALRRIVFGMGALQVLICLGVFAFANYLYNELSPAAILVGASAIALSSTAIVSKELSQRNEITTAHGHIAIGILLFQDIAAIIMLALMSTTTQGNSDQLWTALGITGLKALLYFLAVVAIGKWLLPPLFTEISKTKSEEIFVLAVLVVALLSASVAHWLGLAMALGAFMAGMMLGESHFRHQIELEIRPFRDVLLGIFFVSIGLIIDVELITTYWPRILFFTFCLLCFKAALITLLCLAFRYDAVASVRTGLILSQGGEFGFALLALAQKDKLIPNDIASFFLSIIVLSMAATPFLVANSEKIAHRLLRWRDRKDNAVPDVMHTHVSHHLENHVIICGYGRVGQIIGRFLQQENIAFIAVDDDAVRVERARAAGEPVHFGSARKLNVLKHLGLERASLLIISFDDYQAARAMLTQIRAEREHLPILVRTRDDAHLLELQQAGATEVIPETLEASLMLVSHVMAALGLPGEKVFAAIEQVRQERYKLLHGFILGQNSAYGLSRNEGRLKPVYLPDTAFAVNRPLRDLALDRLQVRIHTIRRGDSIVQNPAEDASLMNGDIVILSGDPAALEAAESYLLIGKG
ncbi:MAG: sodium:proton antiporter [Gammaproteobacteria bacterium]|nr:sodium:proton antiporter [Gammaproteobacteria bacterium]